MELSKQLRTLALGAAITFSVVGMPALHAFAAAPHGITPIHGHPASVAAPALAVQGGATGQGTATDEGCEMAASIINGMVNAAQSELNTNGMTDKWNTAINDAKSVQSGAEDAGCFFVNPV